MLNKLTVHQALEKVLKKKLSALELAVADAIKSRDEETKSSAGDKYETGREMMQKEIDNYEQQLAAVQRQLHDCNAINTEATISPVGAGSLVYTNEGIYYFVTAYGKLQMEEQAVMVVSLGSPLGQSLAGKSAGEKVEFLNRSIEIKSIA